MALEEVELKKLIFDPLCQPRVATPTEYIEEWAERYRVADYEGPAIIVYHDEDTDEFYVADGFCRGAGALAAKRTTILADVRTGNRRTAWVCSLAANARHGLRRTRDDLKKAATAALKDAEFVVWTDARIADDVIGCDHKTITDLRAALVAAGEIPKQAKLQGKDGRWYAAREPKPSQNEMGNSHVDFDEQPTPLPSTARKTSAASARQAAVEAIAAAAEVLTGPPAPAVDSPLDAQPHAAKPDSDWLVELPRKVAVSIATREKFREIVNACDKLMKLVSDVTKEPGSEFFTHWFGRESQREEKDGVEFLRAKAISEFRRNVAFYSPFAPCPYCRGTAKIDGQKCDGCNGHGFVTKSVFNAAPPEMRAAVKAGA